MKAQLMTLLTKVRALFARLAMFQSAQGDDIEVRQQRIIWVIAGTLLGFIAWAGCFQLDIASQGVGEIVPSGQVKRIQHLEGGIVREIYVREGQRVKTGQPLVELESTASDAESAEVESRIGALQIKITRLQAQLQRQREVTFAPELQRKFPEQVAAARQLFHSQRERLSNSNTGQTFKVSQRRAEIDEIRSRIDQLAKRDALLAEQVQISTKLLAEGLTNQYTHLELLQEQTNIGGQLEEARASLRRAEASFDQERVAMSAIDVGENEELRKDLDHSRGELTEMSERLKKFADSARRTIIRSPTDGSVMTLFVVTRGGVIAPGGTVMTLVPGDDRLVVESKLPVSDVGFVQVGQRARLQLMASAGRRLHSLGGVVVHVSPDAISEPDKEPYVLVRIAPDADRFVGAAAVYRLAPGAHLRTSIVTGERTVLGYLLDPFISGMQGAMTES